MDTPMPEQGRWKLPPSGLLGSSAGRNWAGVRIERRRHAAGEIPEQVSPQTVVGIALRGSRRAVILRRGDGLRQATAGPTGTIWLCPDGVSEDSIRITDTIPEMLHIYVPRGSFATVFGTDALPPDAAGFLRYDAGFRDARISRIGQTLLSELDAETSCGRLRVESAALSLAARLLHRYAHRDAGLPDDLRRQSPLDHHRLSRVLDFVENSLDRDIGVGDLASVACLSQAHFARAFRLAMGVPPHRFVARRRLERTKAMLTRGADPLADIALASGFSSQANFTRAFSRAVGLPPGAYRRQTR